MQLRPRLGNKVDLRGRTRAAETRLWRRRAAAPPLPLCRQVNWAFPSWAPRKKQSQSPTSLRAAASLRLGSPAHSSGLPGRGGATSCESLEGEPGRPLYLGLFLGPELHKDLAVLQLPIAFPPPHLAPASTLRVSSPPGFQPLRPEFGLNFRTRQSSPSVRPRAGFCVRPPRAWPGPGFIRPSAGGGAHTTSPRDS